MSGGGCEAVLLDFDGVLLDSEPIHRECWAEVLEPFGIDLTWELYASRCIGVADRVMIEFLAELAQPPVDPEVLWAQYGVKREKFRARTHGNPPYPEGLKRFLASLGRYKLAVVTSSGRCEVEPLLEAGGLAAFFHTAVYREDVARHKPAPDPYTLAAQRLGVRSALVVEDSDAGEASGRAAGFEVLRVAGAHETISRVTERLGLNLSGKSCA